MRDGLSAKPITDNYPAVTADVLGHEKSPDGRLLPPGVVAVAREKTQPVFLLTLDGQVIVCDEDLAVDLVGECSWIS
jgi:hypothetical protein